MPEFDLLEVAEAISIDLAAVARKKKLALVVFMEPELPKLFEGDGGSVKELLHQLAQTAIAACKTSGDIGIGISAGDPSHDSTVGQTAIRFGITYTDIGPRPQAKDAELTAAKLGADLHFRQEVTRGSEFYFILQMQVSPRISDRPLYAIEVGDNNRTFVISNEPPPNRALHLNMRYWGLRCDGAPTMQEGMMELTREAALGQPYDLVVIAEPIDDGTPTQIASIIKTSDLKNTRLIHVDRFYDDKEKRRSLEAGFDAYIAKPFKQADFLKLVGEQLNVATDTAAEAAPHVVLVVDDNLTNQKLAVFQLRRLNFDAAVASNGKDALDAIARRDFSLVLLDLDMPVMGGQETLRRIRQQERFANLPVVIMTAAGDSSLRQKLLDEGANEYLQKPVNLDSMKSLLKRWIPTHSMDSERS